MCRTEVKDNEVAYNNGDKTMNRLFFRRLKDIAVIAEPTLASGIPLGLFCGILAGIAGAAIGSIYFGSSIIQPGDSELFCGTIAACFFGVAIGLFLGGALDFLLLIAFNFIQLGAEYYAILVTAEFYEVLIYHIDDASRVSNLFLKSGLVFVVVVLCMTVVKYFTGKIAILWRSRIVSRIQSLYLCKNRFYKLQLPALSFGEVIDNTDQRISVDVEKYCETLLEMVTVILTSLYRICYYSYRTEELVGAWGPLLVLSFFFLGTGLHRLALQPLVPLIWRQEKLEGDFRFSHSWVRTHAESIALYGGGRSELRLLTSRLADVVENTLQVVKYQFNLNFLVGLTDYGGALLNYGILALSIHWGWVGFKREDFDSDDEYYAALLVLIPTLSGFNLYIVNGVTSLLGLSPECSKLAGYSHRVGEMLEVLQRWDREDEHSRNFFGNDVRSGPPDYQDPKTVIERNGNIVGGVKDRRRDDRLAATSDRYKSAPGDTISDYSFLDYADNTATEATSTWGCKIRSGALVSAKRPGQHASGRTEKPLLAPIEWPSLGEKSLEGCGEIATGGLEEPLLPTAQKSVQAGEEQGRQLRRRRRCAQPCRDCGATSCGCFGVAKEAHSETGKANSHNSDSFPGYVRCEQECQSQSRPIPEAPSHGLGPNTCSLLEPSSSPPRPEIAAAHRPHFSSAFEPCMEPASLLPDSVESTYLSQPVEEVNSLTSGNVPPPPSVGAASATARPETHMSLSEPAPSCNTLPPSSQSRDSKKEVYGAWNLACAPPGADTAVCNVSFTFGASDRVLLRGCSGQGKTTVLRTLSRLWPPRNGEFKTPVRFVDCHGHVDAGGYLHLSQRQYLLPYASLQDQVLYPLSLPDVLANSIPPTSTSSTSSSPLGERQVTECEIRDRIRRALRAVGLENLLGEKSGSPTAAVEGKCVAYALADAATAATEKERCAAHACPIPSTFHSTIPASEAHRSQFAQSASQLKRWCWRACCLRTRDPPRTVGRRRSRGAPCCCITAPENVDPLLCAASWHTILSPGEQQRLCFARILFHRPAFAILDEATSSVDVAHEALMYDKCRTLGIGVLSVGHRASLESLHDRIYTIEGTETEPYAPDLVGE
eukprot:Rmarinus@m.11012